jgi:hypothetical protein
MLKAWFAELAEAHSVKVSATARTGKYYFNVRGPSQGVKRFIHQAMPDALPTSSAGSPEFSDTTYGLPLPDVERILAQLPNEAPWLKWNDSAPLKIARGIREEEAFDRLPILADALEEAGCDNQAILSHCRASQPHQGTCWVVELLLGFDRKGAPRAAKSPEKPGGASGIALWVPPSEE